MSKAFAVWRREFLVKWFIGYRHQIQWPELREAAVYLNVHPRTVYRDLAALREAGHAIPPAVMNGRESRAK